MPSVYYIIGVVAFFAAGLTVGNLIGRKATDCVECKKDAEPVKHGHWISKGIWIECSNCKKTFIKDNIEEAAVYENGLPEYCLHCGAKMDLKDGESNE